MKSLPGFLLFLAILCPFSSQAQQPLGKKTNIAIFGIETINIDNDDIGARVEAAVEHAFTSCDRYTVRFNLPYRKNKTPQPADISAKEVEIQQMIIDLYINRNKATSEKGIIEFARNQKVQSIVIGRLTYHEDKKAEEAYELSVYFIDLDQQSIIREPFYKLIGKKDITNYNFIKESFTRHLIDNHLCVADYSGQINDIAFAKKYPQFLQDLNLLIKLEFLFPGDEDVNRELIEIKKSNRNGILLYLKYKFYFYQVKVNEYLDALNDCIEREIQKNPDNQNAWQTQCAPERDKSIRLLNATIDILLEIQPLLRNPDSIQKINDFIEGYQEIKNNLLKP